MFNLIYVVSMESIMLAIMVGFIVIGLLIGGTKYVYNLIFRKDCRNCKHCSIETSGEGSGDVFYTCKITGSKKPAYVSGQYEKCNSFEQK